MKRSRDRFPDDFMFRLTAEEAKAALSLRSQIVTLKRGQHINYLPYVHLRQLLATNEQLARQIEALEEKVGKHDADLQAILAMLRKILEPPPPPRRPFGFVGTGKK